VLTVNISPKLLMRNETVYVHFDKVMFPKFDTH